MNSLQIDTHVGRKTNEDHQLEYPSPHDHHCLFSYYFREELA
jgi:hypothetical protein